MKQLLYADFFVFILCLFITFLKTYLNNDTNVFKLSLAYYYMFEDYSVILAGITYIFCLILTIFQSSFWILIIYLPIRIAKSKVIKKNRKYEVIDNIEYYRDFFTNLSPAEISIISDLEVEEKKDISATLLKLYLKKFIDFENDSILINHDLPTNSLKESELQLLYSIADGKLNISDKIFWKNICIKEAMSDGYIQKVDVKKRNILGEVL